MGCAHQQWGDGQAAHSAGAVGAETVRLPEQLEGRSVACWDPTRVLRDEALKNTFDLGRAQVLQQSLQCQQSWKGFVQEWQGQKQALLLQVC